MCWAAVSRKILPQSVCANFSSLGNIDLNLIYTEFGSRNMVAVIRFHTEGWKEGESERVCVYVCV